MPSQPRAAALPARSPGTTVRRSRQGRANLGSPVPADRVAGPDQRPGHPAVHPGLGQAGDDPGVVVVTEATYEHAGLGVRGLDLGVEVVTDLGVEIIASRVGNGCTPTAASGRSAR